MSTAPQSRKLNEANYAQPAAQHLRVNSPRQRQPRGDLENEELFIVEGSENWRSTPGHPEERENGAKCAEKPFTAPNCHQTLSMTESEALPLF